MLHNVAYPGFLLRCVMKTIEPMKGQVRDVIVTTQYKLSLQKIKTTFLCKICYKISLPSVLLQ
jgi:hypothetical protein